MRLEADSFSSALLDSGDHAVSGEIPMTRFADFVELGVLVFGRRADRRAGDTTSGLGEREFCESAKGTRNLSPSVS